MPLDPALVVEVSADHITGEHMRHGARLLRWRTDKKPESCTMDQRMACNERNQNPHGYPSPEGPEELPPAVLAREIAQVANTPPALVRLFDLGQGGA